MALVLLSPSAFATDFLIVGGDDLGSTIFVPADLTINMGDRVQWKRNVTLGLGDHSSNSGTCGPSGGVNCVLGPTGPAPGVTWDFFPLPIDPLTTTFVTF